MANLNESIDKFIEEHWTPARELTPEEEAIVKYELGWCGAMICGSKSLYREMNPKNFVIFNSNLCTNEVKIWYGDMDVTLSKKELSNISKKLEKKLYLLYESDGRFENTKAPKIEKAAIVVDGDSITVRQYDWETKGVKEISFNEYDPE